MRGCIDKSNGPRNHVATPNQCKINVSNAEGDMRTPANESKNIRSECSPALT